MTNRDSHKEAYNQRKLISNIWELDEVVILYQNNRSKTLNIVFLCSLLVGLIINYYVLTMDEEAVMHQSLTTFGLLFWQIIFLILGNSIYLSFFWLHNRYLLCIKLLPDKQIEITTWGIIKNNSHLIGHDEISAAFYNEGTTRFPSKPLVYAPYITLQIKGHKRFVLDMQGNFLNGYLAINEVFKKLNI